MKLHHSVLHVGGQGCDIVGYPLCLLVATKVVTWVTWILLVLFG